MTEIETEAAAIAVLTHWCSQRGLAGVDAADDNWQASVFEDCFIIRPSGGRRSNQLYLVRGESVIAFSPATTSLGDAYAALPK
jgi:hypothetical protein